MAYAVPITDEFPFKRFFIYSVFLHLSLTALMLIGLWIQHSGEQWGSIGGGAGNEGVKVSLVSNAGINVPQPMNVTDSHVIDPTKSLHNPEPVPPPPEMKSEATELPKFKSTEKPLPPSRKSRVFEKKTPDADNAVPGAGGSANIPSGSSPTPGPLTNGGVAMSGPGGGDFAGRYPWYVQSVTRAISQNWMQNTIDPGVRAARRAKTTVTFSINRDGTVKNIRITQPSGNRSMDDSAQRALLALDHVPPRPPASSGRSVQPSAARVRSPSATR